MSGPKSIGLFELIREDFRAHGSDWTSPGFRAVAVYRFGVWTGSLRLKFLRAVLGRLHLSLYRYVRNHYSIELERTVSIGRRFVIVNQGAIVIDAYSKIGDDCIVRQGVTLGGSGSDMIGHPPFLGSRVDIGAGAVIIGTIDVGDDVLIGPNAVITRNIPSGSIVTAPEPRMMVLRAKETASDGVDS